MAKKLTRIEKQNSNIEFMKSFNASFLVLYEKELEAKKNKKLDEFKANHSEEETKKYSDTLDSENRVSLARKRNKLDAKVAKKQKHYETKNNLNTKRIWEIDFIRGIVIIGMLIDHFFFDFIGIFTKYNFTNLPEVYLNIGAFANAYWIHPARVTFRFIGLFFLLFLSGISTHFSKNSIKRSLIVIAAGGIISLAFLVVSNFTSKEDMVIMGAVLCIGVCMLIYSLYKLIFYRFKKVYKWLTLILAIGILVMWVFVSRNVATDTSNFWFYYNGYARSIPVIYSGKLGEHIWEVLLGTAYFGSDWMGLFPALGYMFLGGFIGETVYKNRTSIFKKYNEKLNKNTLAIVVPGRYSLWFYLLHQVIYIIIIGGLALLMGAQIAF